MLKDNKDAQLYVKTTLRELFLYCIFLFVICYGKNTYRVSQQVLYSDSEFAEFEFSHIFLLIREKNQIKESSKLKRDF